MRRLALLAMIIVAGCAQKPKDSDACKAPVKPPYDTKASLEKGTPDNPEGMTDVQPSFVSQLNREADFDFCAKTAAYQARKLRDPMDAITKGIMATCHFPLSIYLVAKNPPKTGANQSFQEFQQVEREGDENDKTRQTLAWVLKYRTCSTGQVVSEDDRNAAM